MTEKFDIKFLRLFAKITGKGGRGGLVFFHEVRKVLGCHMPNFRSLGQSLHIDDFCKNEGGGGGPIILLSEKAKSIIFSYQKIVVI